MKLIIGLGNPGEEHKNNRHNVGYMTIDKLIVKSSKLKGIVVAKTDTFMNDSGRFVSSLVARYKIPTTSLYIIHDDLDIKLGEYKIHLGRGPKNHKGLGSIDEALGTRDYWHVRVGIEARAQRPELSGEQYVLQDFAREERAKIEEVTKKVVKDLLDKYRIGDKMSVSDTI